ncbi:MAG: Uma2 family endonuclease, partial [Coprococcus sp.]
MLNKGSAAMLLFTEGNYTIDDIYALPEGERAELIEGQICDMATPTRIHQKIAFSLAKTISNYIDAKEGSCEVYPAPFAVIIKKDNKNYVEPDVSVICDKDKLSDRGCEGAPDFIIEVVSPSSRTMDYSTKNALYADAGVREYWIVDPDRERTTIYHYEVDAAPMIVPFNQTIQVGIYKDLHINISELLV